MGKEFKLDKSIELPKQISKVMYGSKIIYISKETTSFIVLNKLESELLEKLKNGETIREASSNVLRKTNETAKQIRKSTLKTLEKIEESNFYLIEDSLKKDTLPLQLYITNKCNLQCKQCYKDAGQKLDNELTSEEIIRLIDNVSTQGTTRVNLSGGEPLIHPDFFQIVDYINQKKHKISVVSNGLLIKDIDSARKITEKIDTFQISLDGATAEFNDYYRGKGTYNKIIEKINLFANTNYVINIGMVVSEINFKDIYNNLENLLSKINSVKIKLNLSNIMDFGRGIQCNERGGRELIYKIIQKAETLGIKLKKEKGQLKKVYDCGFARSITVDSDGAVYYCPVIHEYTKTNLNIRENTFEEILKIIKGKNKTISVEKMENCNDCNLEYICGGGCRIDNKRFRGNYLKHEEGCEKSRKRMIYKEMLIQRGII